MMTTYDLFEQLTLTIDEMAYFQNTLISPVYRKSSNVLEVTLECHQLVNFSVYQKIIKQLEDKFGCEVRVNLSCLDNKVEYLNLMKYIEQIVVDHKLNKKLLRTSTRLDDNKLVFLANNDDELAKIGELLEVLEPAIIRMGLPITTATEMVVISDFLDMQPQTTTRPAVEKPKAVTQKRERKRGYTMVNIAQLLEPVDNIKVRGTIFKIDKRVTKIERIEVTLYIFHENDALDGIYYIDHEEDLTVSVGDTVLLSGHYRYHTYRRENKLTIEKVEKIEASAEFKDDANEKRIELHAHTKSSEMDGICDTYDLVKQAYDYGHDAIAITDHMVVHSFPAAQRAMNKLNKGTHQIKVLYGVELNMVEDTLKAVRNSQSQSLLNATYIVFDLETTGLSSRRNEIIEFGAVKVVNQTVVDSKQFFIKPKRSIPANIEKLTGISNAMVKDGYSLDKAMKEILAFIGSDILVAHNASFDVRFLQDALLQLDLPPLTNTVLDTLDLSRMVIDLKRSYSLGSVARYYKIAYDQEVAHRADYDAQVLSSVLGSLLNDCAQLGYTTMDDLVVAQKEAAAYDKSMKYHVNVLAKNDQGLKAIYELVSLSHTKYLRFRGKSTKKVDESNAEPRIPRHEINRLRANLLIGSACYNSLLFEIARTGSMRELEEEMAFYDYIEIQPLENYNPLLFTHSIASQDELIAIIKDIIKVASKLNKPVVATGDVHYLHAHHKVFRDVYINAIGLGGVRHPLYVYDNSIRKSNELPNQHLRTTQEMLQGYPYLEASLVKQMVIDNPKRIANQIEVIQPIPDELFTPTIEGSDEKLTELVMKNAHNLYGNPLPEIVSSRLKRELDAIISNGYGVIYYTSHLLVKESLDHGYMVGSRGSVGSSFVATMAEITEVNPLKPHYVCPKCHHSEFFLNEEVSSGYDLDPKDCPHCLEPMIREGQDIPFETFLGFQGDKVPDIDLNFSSEFQEQAHAFTKEIFGEDKVLRAGTISTIADKTAFGHVTGYFEEYPDKQTAHSAYKEYLTMGCTGVKRSTGQHPGGIIVIPQDKDVFDFTPYQFPANNPDAAWLTTHFEFNDIHDNVLKLDILGHVDPTAMKYLERHSGIDVRTIPMNDPLTMSLFHSTDALKIDERRALDKNGAVGLPEFGTGFVRRLLDDTKPTKFSDLVRISGLSHGTDVWVGNAQQLINDGLTLQDVIGCRDDIMTYLSHQGLEPMLAFTIMESVRKGRGLKPEWIEKMTHQNIAPWYIESCLKIKYLFPKAHAVAYCIMGYRVAWFKVHHPLYFYGQYFTLRCDAYEVETMIKGTDAILARLNDINGRRNSYNIENKVTNKEIQLINTLEVALEMNLRGYYFSPLNINTSPATEFIPDPQNPKNLLIPFTAIDGLGAGVAQSVVEARQENAFLSLEDVQQRTGLNQTLIQRLKQMDAVDGLSETNQMSLF